MVCVGTIEWITRNHLQHVRIQRAVSILLNHFFARVSFCQRLIHRRETALIQWIWTRRVSIASRHELIRRRISRIGAEGDACPGHSHTNDNQEQIVDKFARESKAIFIRIHGWTVSNCHSAGYFKRQSISTVPVFVAHQRKKDRKSTRLNSSHSQISYAVFCLKK